MYFWTSEAVAAGHPDKVADQIADGILDHVLTLDPRARCASEVTITSNFCLLTGEIGANLDPAAVEARVRKIINDIGYDRGAHAFDGGTCEIMNKINRQSVEIAKAVEKDGGEIGAGDQGMMFGYAVNEIPLWEQPSYMPLAHHLSFELIRALEADMRAGRSKDGDWVSPLRPDAKTQVTVQYADDGTPERIDTVVISVCHIEQMTLGDVRGYVKDRTKSVKEKFGKFFDNQTKWLINPAGTWNIGGPASDTGLSGRKIVVDNYGGDCPIGGGSFSGKDPTKVDRSGAYAARWLAKNIVAAGVSHAATVQVAYAIGVTKPVSLRIDLKGSQGRSSAEIIEIIENNIDLSPKGIIERLDLRRPIYQKTASGGHFGRSGFPWEELNLVDMFKG
jgi:S-adenosylmethionine synthetase